MAASFSWAAFFVSGAIQSSASMRFAMAAWTSLTMASASAFTAGGKTFATKTWPSASPRSASVQRDAALPAGRELLRPTQGRRVEAEARLLERRGEVGRGGADAGASAGRSSRRRAAPSPSSRSSSATKAGSVTFSQARPGRRTRPGSRPSGRTRALHELGGGGAVPDLLRVALLDLGERRLGERRLDPQHRPGPLGGLLRGDGPERRSDSATWATYFSRISFERASSFR